mmetsp:Transcript_74788/g.206192  ORF Transcript_74788/g.206192 Transcript_74788/m.206192 type:complete len:215 (+) Transcript_74788:526-1170(+)
MAAWTTSRSSRIRSAANCKAAPFRQTAARTTSRSAFSSSEALRSARPSCSIAARTTSRSAPKASVPAPRSVAKRRRRCCRAASAAPPAAFSCAQGCWALLAAFAAAAALSFALETMWATPQGAHCASPRTRPKAAWAYLLRSESEAACPELRAAAKRRMSSTVMADWLQSTDAMTLAWALRLSKSKGCSSHVATPSASISVTMVLPDSVSKHTW